ncbi:transcription factor TFIIIB component B'' [Populus alba x Populus x berolinensis]|uniref:Transcription factor TFIIIB component B n=1 Tax=Populus alba x Populus x berolinensis TaxID=444605 RepID=A0AAD6M8A5_9ROSI|nr:transcription factor TFIIIB component B'' [Populus alba x Populus x berolinensis]
MNQELKNLTETSRSDNVTAIHQEDASDLPEKETSSSRKRKTAPVSCSSWKSQKASLAEYEAHGNDDSSMHPGDFLPVDPCTSEFQVDQNQKDFTESNCLANANVLRSEDVPIVPEKESSKSGKRKVFSASNCSRKSKKSSLAAGPQVVDELDEAHDNGGLPEPPGSSVDEEDNDNEPRGDEESDDENRVEIASRKKRASKKSKEPVTENEKPVRKRNRSNDTPEQSTQKNLTRNFLIQLVETKDVVISIYVLNKDLLNMPEDEIDFKRLPIRDIILFAEHKERLAMTTSKIPPNNQRYALRIHFMENIPIMKEDGFASEEDITHGDDQTYVRAQPSSSLFNYQSFMDRAPNSRWSKQDTELFYELRKLKNLKTCYRGQIIRGVQGKVFPVTCIIMSGL